VSYRGMNIYYSGYRGLDGKPGNEYIDIQGRSGSTVNLEFRVYTFKLDSALSDSVTVSYSWQRAQTPCCLGQAVCTSSFNVAIKQGQTVDLGEIPRGKGDVTVNLDSEGDLDIQLYDLDDTSEFVEGKAIIGFCVGANCNLGVINSATQVTQSYYGNFYTYSGFTGDGRGPGYEFVTIAGYSNRKLKMRVYGFSSGTAKVTYSYLEAAALLTSSKTFNFGDSCKGGQGTASVVFNKTNDVTNIGIIPSGQRDLDVRLVSDNGEDIDIQVTDLDDTAIYYVGKAVVASCNLNRDPNCNQGLLSGSSVASVDYKNNRYTYSGWSGQNGNRGDEYVRIIGDLNTRVLVSAYAYQQGKAQVTYSWTGSQSACCLGTSTCTGNFNLYVPRFDYSVLGNIPTGVQSVRIDLTSTTDVDIQLFDLDDTSQFAEGKAIIAFCAGAGCNLGVLGTSPTPETAVYQGLTYSYSGFGGVNGVRGNEYIEISGTTNRRLEMRAYGYEGGVAGVNYSFRR